MGTMREALRLCEAADPVTRAMDAVDWYYQFSDDPRAYRAGEKQQVALQALVRDAMKLNPEVTRRAVEAFVGAHAQLFAQSGVPDPRRWLKERP